MAHINITHCIVRYEDGRINERETCEKIDAHLKDRGYEYVKAMFTNSFSYFGNKPAQLRIIIDGAKAGWRGAHTRKFVLVQHENIDFDKLYHLNEAGKTVVEWKKEAEEEEIKEGTNRRANMDVGIRTLQNALAKADKSDYRAISATIDELRALQNRIY